jgi:dTDP-4-amino-4,6-dideoxygalactose transaminase
VGCNSRLDTIQAAVLDIKLKHLDNYIAARRRVADYYDHAFTRHPKITVPYRAPYADHVFHQYTLLVEGIDRNNLNAFLAAQNIPSMIYYPVPAHRQKMFSSFDSANTDLPVTDWLAERVISLPIHTEMDNDQLQFITSKIIEFANK